MSESKLVLGLMSGTSLDGVDAALCSFTQSDIGWNYKILYADTIPYSNNWKKNLSDAFSMSGRELTKLDADYGKYLGNISNKVLESAGKKAELISSHGHTVFHDPDKGYTLQIGNGSNIASETGIPVVCNFRVNDLAAGGQGAPLAPVGDYYLFNQYEACLNLGGFANISFDEDSKRIAFDICPVNIVLNYLSQKAGEEFDASGEMGKRGAVVIPLLKKLNELSYYMQGAPKSLAREWLESEFIPLIDEDKSSISDKLRTVYQHIVDQLVIVIKTHSLQNVMISGGGVHNKFMVELLKHESGINIVIPDTETINYKEAIIFAFLGFLRSMNKVNCFASVTGALRDTFCGILYLP